MAAPPPRRCGRPTRNTCQPCEETSAPDISTDIDVDIDAAVRGFLEAAHTVGGVLRLPAVGAAWDEPSALPKMTVGAVAGHVLLIIRRVDQHLDDPQLPYDEEALPLSYQWARIVTADDLDRPEHLVVRDDGGRVAAWGWQSVKESYVKRLTALETRLAGPLPATVTLGGRIPFGTYLETRVVELLVHADDLCVSVGLPGADLPAHAADVAIGALTAAARSVHGDLAVLRALTRSERTNPPVPSVY